jgi:hypothetical protein
VRRLSPCVDNVSVGENSTGVRLSVIRTSVIGQNFSGPIIYRTKFLRTDYPVQPLLYLSISKPYQLSSTDPTQSIVG